MNEGPRAQTTARAAGGRPGVLKEPEPQIRAFTVGYVAAPVPSVAPPALAAPAAEAVDSRALTFLLGCALEVQRKEEEALREVERENEKEKLLKESAERFVQRMQALDSKISANLPVSKDEWILWRRWSQSRPQPSSSSSSGVKRKRKKKRRKRKSRPPPPASRRT